MNCSPVTEMVQAQVEWDVFLVILIVNELIGKLLILQFFSPNLSLLCKNLEILNNKY